MTFREAHARLRALADELGYSSASLCVEYKVWDHHDNPGITGKWTLSVHPGYPAPYALCSAVEDFGVALAGIHAQLMQLTNPTVKDPLNVETL